PLPTLFPPTFEPPLIAPPPAFDATPPAARSPPACESDPPTFELPPARGDPPTWGAPPLVSSPEPPAPTCPPAPCDKSSGLSSSGPLQARKNKSAVEQGVDVEIRINRSQGFSWKGSTRSGRVRGHACRLLRIE